MKRSVQYLLSVGIITLLFSGYANAESNSLVISHVQAGAASGQAAAATQEFIIVYNNTSVEIDVTDWCVANKDKTVACMSPTSPRQTFRLPAYTYMVIVSDSLAAHHPDYIADLVYATTNSTSGSVIGGADTVSLKDARGNTVDSVSWTSSLTGGLALQRRGDAASRAMVDTDQSSDFSKVQGIQLPVASVYEVVTETDECLNIADLQTEIPSGLARDEEGNCVVDECSNMDGLQTAVPEEYIRTGVNECTFDYVALQISELLPNASGSDIGREYIELYNPTGRDAYLMNYVLQIGNKSYSFPLELKIRPGEYMAFYNNEMNFTLLNTTGAAVLLSDDGSVVSQSDAYNSPDDDMSWSVINGVWQYSNQMTFAAANMASIFEQDGVDVQSGVAPCAANQYRHPETRRCRMLVTAPAVAAPCRDGQYRSEETNRCRMISLAGGTLAPCKEDQYRSEETNRCRNLTTLARTLTPCKDDQYRSEETNRCRTIAAASAPAAFAVEPIPDIGMAFAGWWTLGAVVAIALGYGVWEWRLELIGAMRKALSFFTQR